MDVLHRFGRCVCGRGKGAPGTAGLCGTTCGQNLLEHVALAFMRNQKPNVIHDEMRARFSEECDYALEARTQKWFHSVYADDPRIEVPAVIDRWSRRRVLTSTYCHGQSLEVFARQASQTDRDLAEVFNNGVPLNTPAFSPFTKPLTSYVSSGFAAP